MNPCKPFLLFSITIVDSVGSRGFNSPVGGIVKEAHTRTHTHMLRRVCHMYE